MGAVRVFKMNSTVCGYTQKRGAYLSVRPFLLAPSTASVSVSCFCSSDRQGQLLVWFFSLAEKRPKTAMTQNRPKAGFGFLWIFL
jgi:hypothetical protein